MKPPSGLTIPHPKFVCKLHRSIYSIKQANRNWNHKLIAELFLLGYSQSTVDQSMFVKSIESLTTILLVYVDDLCTVPSQAQSSK